MRDLGSPLDALNDFFREAVGRLLDEKLAPIQRDLETLKKQAPPPLVAIGEFCAAAKCSPATARRWAASGQVKTVRRGRVIRFDLSSLRGPDEGEIARMAREARQQP